MASQVIDSRYRRHGYFITGWMPAGATKSTKPAGRPVGIVIGADGSMYISDDNNGAIYRVTYTGK